MPVVLMRVMAVAHSRSAWIEGAYGLKLSNCELCDALSSGALIASRIRERSGLDTQPIMLRVRKLNVNWLRIAVDENEQAVKPAPQRTFRS